MIARGNWIKIDFYEWMLFKDVTLNFYFRQIFFIFFDFCYIFMGENDDDQKNHLNAKACRIYIKWSFGNMLKILSFMIS